MLHVMSGLLVGGGRLTKCVCTCMCVCCGWWGALKEMCVKCHGDEM